MKRSGDRSDDHHDRAEGEPDGQFGELQYYVAILAVFQDATVAVASSSLKPDVSVMQSADVWRTWWLRKVKWFLERNRDDCASRGIL